MRRSALAVKAGGAKAVYEGGPEHADEAARAPVGPAEARVGREVAPEVPEVAPAGIPAHQPRDRSHAEDARPVVNGLPAAGVPTVVVDKPSRVREGTVVVDKPSRVREGTVVPSAAPPRAREANAPRCRDRSKRIARRGVSSEPGH